MKLDMHAQVRRANGFTLDVQLLCDTPVLGLVGPSGCGKSTLLDAIAGIEPGARVTLDGHALTGVPLHRRGIGYVTQDALLFPHLTLRQNIAYSPAAGPVDEVAHALGIAHLLDRMPRHVSGGERRRVALARAIVSRPKLLLLDEPFGGLDEARRREALALVHDVHRTFNVPMVIVSHLREEVIGLAEHVVHLEQGRIVHDGPATALLRVGETRVDNYLAARVVGAGRVEVDGVVLEASLPADAQGAVRLACYANHIRLAVEPPAASPPRNVIAARVEAVTPAGDGLLVSLDRPRLRVLVTPDEARALALAPGREIVAVIDAAALTAIRTVQGTDA
jgi:molybdate transport system ATP-binding protein